MALKKTVEAARLPAGSAPIYQRIKALVVEKIATGEWVPGQKLPSEIELVVGLGVSRMTIHRALRELAAEGQLKRVMGVGTFVGALKSEGHVLKIRNIADEIRERGGIHRARLLDLRSVTADRELATRFGLQKGVKLFHSMLLHLEDERPIQLEDRYVNPLVAPNYLKNDFTQSTPTEYLTRVAVVQEVEHIVEAVLPSAKIRQLLRMTRHEPCLLLRRRTWASFRVASNAALYFAGSRYRLGDRFSPH